MRKSTLLALAALALATPSATAKSWFVRAGAPAGGKGTKQQPLDSLTSVEAMSKRGDRIVVMRSKTPLEGGIRLKRRQRLVGAGRSVKKPAQRLPRITNADPARLKGDAVRLASGALVRNLVIEDAARGAIYGRNVVRATVRGNVISGHNATCVPGFLIPPFNVPTTAPGVGIPISDGLSNGWAGILVDATKGRSRVTIARNRVGPAECGDGIDVRASGAASVTARIRRNAVKELREGPDFESVLAFGLQSSEQATLEARLDRNRQSGLGNDEDTGAGPTGADSEGVFINPVGPSELRATVTRNTYEHTPGRGGFSANGLEYVTMGDGSRSSVDVRDSSFSGTPGDVLEQLALGTNSSMLLRLDGVTGTASTGFGGSGFGDTVIIPGNNGDCLLGASGGAGNVVELEVRRSTLTNCANNGITLGSAVANGEGATKLLRFEMSDSTVTGNRGANLRIGNLSALERLVAKVERTDLGDSQGGTSSPANLVVEELGTTGEATIDLGGGALGSAGGNCLDGGQLAAAIVGYDVSVRKAWWGDPAGPPPGRVVGALDAADPLPAAPDACVTAAMATSPAG